MLSNNFLKLITVGILASTTFKVNAAAVPIEPFAKQLTKRGGNSTGQVIPDWGDCNLAQGDTCAISTSECCVDKRDYKSGHYQCRPFGYNCGYFWDVPDWAPCHPGQDKCSNKDSKCCVSNSDLSSGKFTCRPSGKDCADKQPIVSPKNQIQDWQTCNPKTDECKSFDSVCCIAQADQQSGKHTCRPKGKDCDGISPPQSSPSPTPSPAPVNLIPDWETCVIGKDACSGAHSVCCVAKADQQSGKHTCRPYAKDCDTAPPPSSPSASPTPVNLVPDWQNCNPGKDSCSNHDSKCCVAKADKQSGKHTCRPFGKDCDDVLPSPSPSPVNLIPDWKTCNPGKDSCANKDSKCCVADADQESGKHTCRPFGKDCSDK